MPEKSVHVACVHCGGRLPQLGPESVAFVSEGFCCVGCATVHRVLKDAGLAERYYGLRGAGAAAPASVVASADQDLTWLEPIERAIASHQGTSAVRVSMDIQGIHCTACVWLLEEIARRRPACVQATVNPALGRIELLVRHGFDLREYVGAVGGFGYRLGPPRKQASTTARPLVARIGVAFALAMNSMLFALPIYLGLREGLVYHAFRWLTLAIGAGSLWVGGSVFIRSAWLALRRGIIHLDVPIALGLILAFAGSALSFLAGNDRGAYFDTLSIFVALMLVGRWLQERVLERNRNRLLAADGTDSLRTRLVRDGRVDLKPVREIRAGDQLLLAPGDLLPVAARLESPKAACRLDWITGESDPQDFQAGDPLMAGAFNVGRAAVFVRAEEAFEHSILVDLLRAPPAEEDAARRTAWWQNLSTVYVVAVLVVAAVGFAAWWHYAGFPRALEVTTAVLVVTCPCAFGIATPLAYELIQAGLRRVGIFVRSPSFLDRATAVRTVVFDKTGTLTTGELRLADPHVLDALDDAASDVLYDLAARSSHPRAAAVRKALETRGAPVLHGDLHVEETPGAGLTLVRDGRTWRLGRAGWAADGADGDAEGALVFGRDGLEIARVSTVEDLRAEAGREIAALRADGYAVQVLSGDAPARVEAIARELGIPAESAVGGLTPDAKRAWIVARGASQVLMLGDGINDGPAVDAAGCSGTPAVDRPFMPARTDFFVVAPGIAPLSTALRAARRLVWVHQRNLGIAVAYNVLSIAIALSGWATPVVCAVFMPISSLTVVLATVASLSPRSPFWTSSSSSPSAA